MTRISHIAAVSLFGSCILLPGLGLAEQPKATPTPATQENPTAYVALRTIKQEFGQDALKQIIEVSGREGVPQPYIWRVTMNVNEKAAVTSAASPSVHSKAAKGSSTQKQTASDETLKEIDIADGKIVGQRKLTRSSRALVGVPLDFQNLNLDSSGAFQLADKQARKVNLSFEALAYTLRADPSGKPIWTLQILDSDRNDVGSISIAATDAAVINATGHMAVENKSEPTVPQKAAATSRSQSSHSTRHRSSQHVRHSGSRSNDSGFLERSGRTLSKAGDSVKTGFEKTGKKVFPAGFRMIVTKTKMGHDKATPFEECSTSELVELSLVKEEDGKIALLRLNRLSKANAYDAVMLDSFAAKLEEVANSKTIRALIITGQGDRVFCAGADKNELNNARASDGLNLRSKALFDQLAQLSVPTIAAINGVAAGGGLELALACDIRICAATAEFFLPELSLGLLPAAGGIARLPSLIGLSRAKEMILFGRRIDAGTALNWGLVAYVGVDFENEAVKLARKAGGYNSMAMGFAKRTIDSHQGPDQQQSIAVAQASLYEQRFQRAGDSA